MSATRIPLGNEATLPFYFASRPLRPAEVKAWEEGAGLPVGVGVDPSEVEVEMEHEGTPSTLTCTRQAAGWYYATYPAVTEGTFKWRGVGKTGAGGTFAATVWSLLVVS